MTGVISISPRGFGFLAPDGGGADCFVPPSMTGGALSGDRVRARGIPDPRGRGPCARVLEIVLERPAAFVGELRHGGEAGPGWQVCPLDRGLPDSLPVRSPHFVSAHGTAPAHGQWVEARLSRRPGQEPQAELLRPQSDAGSVMERLLTAVATEYQLEPAYTPAENHAAMRVHPAPAPERRDRTELTVVAIDPKDAKDHDDALSLEPGPGPGLVRVGVHIADVAAYVRPGSELDAGAAARCFTSYLPGRTLPMLPPSVVSGRCSLVTGEPRLAHSVFLDVETATGRVVATHRQHTRLQITRVLTYDEVRDVLETDQAPADWPAAVARSVRALAKTAAALRRRRAREEGFILIELPEVRLHCAENPPRIVELVREEPNAAHELVEEFMLAANSAVAAELAERGIPGLFRVHDEPGAAELAEFRCWARDQFGFGIGALTDRAAVNRFLGKLEGRPDAALIAVEFLKTLPRAVYTTEPRLHFGLGKELYSHFTSPIRRYADLLVHQQLWAADHGEPNRDLTAMKAAAERITGRERLNDSAYFSARDRLKLLWLGEQTAAEPGRPLEGVVAETVKDGCRIYLPEWGLTGFLPNAAAGGRPRGGARGGRGRQAAGKIRKSGDSILTLARRADPVRGTLELGLPTSRPAGQTRPPERGNRNGEREPQRPGGHAGSRATQHHRTSSGV